MFNISDPVAAACSHVGAFLQTCRLPLMTNPKLLPSLCKQMSIVFDITPELLSGALGDGEMKREKEKVMR